MTERVPCLVPGCGRTTLMARLRFGGNQWICQRHWSGTSRVWRRRYSLFRRRGRFDLALRMWARLKRQAIERARGI